MTYGFSATQMMRFKPGLKLKVTIVVTRCTWCRLSSKYVHQWSILLVSYDPLSGYWLLLVPLFFSYCSACQVQLPVSSQ